MMGGGGLYVLDAQDREGPQAREPSKCPNGWNYGERPAKEKRGLLIARYKRLEKRL